MIIYKGLAVCKIKNNNLTEHRIEIMGNCLDTMTASSDASSEFRLERHLPYLKKDGREGKVLQVSTVNSDTLAIESAYKVKEIEEEGEFLEFNGGIHCFAPGSRFRSQFFGVSSVSQSYDHIRYS